MTKVIDVSTPLDELYLQEMYLRHSKNVSWWPERIPVIGALFSLYAICSDLRQYLAYEELIDDDYGSDEQSPYKDIYIELKKHKWEAIESSLINVTTLGFAFFFGFKKHWSDSTVKVLGLCIFKLNCLKGSLTIQKQAWDEKSKTIKPATLNRVNTIVEDLYRHRLEGEVKRMPKGACEKTWQEYDPS